MTGLQPGGSAPAPGKIDVIRVNPGSELTGRQDFFFHRAVPERGAGRGLAGYTTAGLGNHLQPGVGNGSSTALAPAVTALLQPVQGQIHFEHLLFYQAVKAEVLFTLESFRPQVGRMVVIQRELLGALTGSRH
jgi:hypothetical protein